MHGNRRNFRVYKVIGVEEHDGNVRFQTGSGNAAVSRMRNKERRNITLIYGRIAEISASLRKWGSRNTIMISDFRPKVEI